MQQTNRGHLKMKSPVNDRVIMENIKRVFIAAAFCVVFFFAEWCGHLLVRPAEHEAIMYYVAMTVFPLISLAIAGTAFYALSHKRRDMKWIAYVFWGYFFVESAIIAGLAQGRLYMMLDMMVLATILALVPLWSDKEFCVVAVLQFAASIQLLFTERVDGEHLAYLMCAQVLCCILSRQAYYEFLRQVKDATKLNSAKNQAETDPMTRLLNRRGLERRIAHIWPLCVRQGIDMAVIMLDIDNFKKYNDQFGHPAGDECIKAVAKVLLKHTKRKTDYCARVGGEEFLILLNGLSAKDALLWAQECKKTIEDLMIPHAKDNFLPFVTVSMGICHTSAHVGTEFWEMRNEADRSLYQAKENGRACICMGDKCYARTTPELNRKQYYIERGFRSLG